EVSVGRARAIMMRVRPALAVAGGVLAIVPTASTNAQEAMAQRPSFERLRQDEDWSALCDPSRRTLWYDAMKCLPLSDDRTRWLSIGGELRERYEYTRNPVWGDDPQDKRGVLLQRYTFHGDLHLGPNLRLFGQLYSALENGRAGSPGPIDE